MNIVLLIFDNVDDIFACLINQIGGTACDFFSRALVKKEYLALLFITQQRVFP